MVAPQLVLSWYPTPMSPDVITAPDLWLEDGDVVLAAGNTRYKLNASHLACHSSRFRAMFMETALEMKVSGTYEDCDGCPLYTLPHEAEEVTLMLRRMMGFDRYALVKHQH